VDERRPVLEVVHAGGEDRHRGGQAQGLTYFLMDMEQEGVQVRPLRQITGESEFNELFIDGGGSRTRMCSAALATAGRWR